MIWNPIILGIIDDPYSNNIWVLPVIAVFGTLLCFYRYKLAWVVIPIVSIIAVIFLAGFLEPQNYQHIQSLSHTMPRILTSIAVFTILPIIGTYLSWRRTKNRQAVLP